jgi:hypothetical protein
VISPALSYDSWYAFGAMDSRKSVTVFTVNIVCNIADNLA